MHEGSTDPGLTQELHAATDFALRAMKVTARSFGKAMSIMVVQECHLWLNLVEKKDVDMARFRDARISQAGLFGDTHRGLYPAVLGGTATDRGDPAHPAPAWCTGHRCHREQATLRPILTLRVMNRALHKLPFKMLTHRLIIKCIQPQDWFAAIDLKDAYFHVSFFRDTNRS